MVEQRQSALQRIQVGLVGLVVVLLFVSLANMVLDRVTGAASVNEGPGVTTTGDTAALPSETPAEPLAELGVTPVATEGLEEAQRPAADDRQNAQRTPVDQQR